MQATLAALLTLGLSSFGATMAHANDATTATITGTVTLDAKIAPKLKVCAFIPSATAEYACAITSDSGVYEFTVPVAGTTEDASVWVDPSVDYPQADSGHFRVEPGQPVVKDIAIRSFPRVSGTVVDQVTTLPIAGAKVCAGDSDDPGADYCDFTDNAGNYSTRALAYGPNFGVLAEAPGYLALQRSGVKATDRLILRLAPVSVASAQPPITSAKPTITSAKPTVFGKVKVGKRLTAMAGTWGPGGVQLSYQWLRNGKVIRATDSTYKLTNADRGKKIQVQVTGRVDGYAAVTKASKATKKVAKR